MVVDVGGDNWGKNTSVSYIDEGSNPKVHTCVQGGKGPETNIDLFTC